MKKLIIYSFGLSILSLFLSNCASLSGFQDGRTVGKNNGEVTASLNFTQSPDFNELGDNDSLGTSLPNLLAPNIEVLGQFGAGEKVDIGLRINSNLNVGVSAKFQVVGDRESKFALAIGGEAGTFGLITGLWNVQVPVYASIHPSDNFTWYLSPRYIYQFSSYGGADNGLSYLGGNTGLMFGKRNRFGIDFGYYNLGYYDSDNVRRGIGLVNFGVGGKFKIGKN